MELRDWQQECLNSFIARRKDGRSMFVFEACPGAGKSLMAAVLSEQMLNDTENPIDFVLVVVPWKSIQGDAKSGMIRAFDERGLRVRERLMLRGARIVQQPVPVNLDCVITTYAEAMTQESVETLAMWAHKGLRIAVIFDEIHHANELNGVWGDYANEVNYVSSMTIIMSGTYFRTDGKPIKFVEYVDDRPVLHCPAYKYSQAVSDKVCRPVSCRYTDVELKCVQEDSGVEFHSLFEFDPSDSRLGAVMREVFDPEGDCVRTLIYDLNQYMDRTRRRFPNAGALITCRPGRGEKSEDKHVHQIAQKITQYTGQEVTVVTHNDKNAQGKIDAFRKGSSPYLVAVNMISEGVDIPRLRAVAMLRYISSEMMFRQIIGRAVRMTHDEDGTAAQIFMPKFRLMHEFGVNLDGESLTGLKSLKCKSCGEYPCICICEYCYQEPCVCEHPPWLCPTCGRRPCVCPYKQKFGILEANAIGGGGSISSDEVAESMITIAKFVMNQSVYHHHANEVQLAHALSIGLPMVGHEDSRPDHESPLVRLDRARTKVTRLVNRLAGKKFGGDFARCWTEVVTIPYGVEWKVAKDTWSIHQIEQLAISLEEQLVEAFRNGKS
jgi:superfamily II DNA or RNA helicase